MFLNLLRKEPTLKSAHPFLLLFIIFLGFYPKKYALHIHVFLMRFNFIIQNVTKILFLSIVM